MLGSLLILLAMPVLDTSRVRGGNFRPFWRVCFWFLVVDLVLLGWLGSQHAEEPYITIGAYASIFYFSWYLIIVPVVGIVENTLADLDLDTNNRPLFVPRPSIFKAIFQSRSFHTSFVPNYVFEPREEVDYPKDGTPAEDVEQAAAQAQKEADDAPSTAIVPMPNSPFSYALLNLFMNTGSFYMLLRWRKDSSSFSLNNMKITCKIVSSLYNMHQLYMAKKELQLLGVNCSVQHQPGTTFMPACSMLIITGIKNLFEVFVPLILECGVHVPWLLIKFQHVLFVRRLIACNGHLTYLGMLSLFNYGTEHKSGFTRLTVEVWKQRLEEYKAKSDKISSSGHQHISEEGKSMRVRFPDTFNLGANKRFIFSTYNSRQEALDAAIMYRDEGIRNYLIAHDVACNI